MNIRKTNTLNQCLKLIVLILLLLNLIIITSCNNDNPVIDRKTDDLTIFPEEFKGFICDKTIYFTSIGQSNDSDNFKITVLDNLDLFDYTYDKMISIDNIPNNSVVFVFVGCSVKALGESGITITEELERTNDFIKKISEKNITLISLHIGGQARRGSTSNQFIELMFSNSTFNIFVETGNYDYFLSDLSKENNIPCYQIISITELDSTIRLLYGDN